MLHTKQASDPLQDLLEYACIICSLYTYVRVLSNTDRLEKVQRKAVRFAIVCSDHDFSMYPSVTYVEY